MTSMKICSLSILSLLILAGADVFAQQEQSVQEIVEGELPSLLAIYKDIHSHPELSWYEEKTSALIAKELRAAGCEVTENFGKYDKSNLKSYGVVGIMKNGEGPTVLVRTDMDALPVEEETGLPYASKVVTKNDEGKDVHVAHACGHDAHMAAFIGTVRALQQLRNEWQGTIMFVGQPAEEVGNGARALLKGGLYNRFGKPNFALGYHDNAFLETGKIGICEGYTYANVDSVNITVRGVGGHGAYPHKTKDPIVLSAEIINALQTIVSRENNPIDPVVVTVGSIHGGTKHNIIPDEVKMQLTVRTYKSDVRDRVLAAIDRITKGCAVAAGIPPERAPGRTDAAPLDLAGLILLAAGLTGVLYSASLGPGDSWASPARLVPLAIGAVLLAGYAVWAVRHPHPVLDLALLRRSVPALALMLCTLASVVTFAAVFLLPVFAQVVQGHSAAATGLALLPQGVITGLGTVLGQRLLTRVSVRTTVVFGFAVLTAASLGLLAIGAQTPLWVTAAILAGRAAAIGLVITPLLFAVTNALGMAELADANTLFNICQRIAGALGIGLIAALFTALARTHGAVPALHDTGLLLTVLAALATAAAIMLPRERTRSALAGT